MAKKKLVKPKEAREEPWTIQVNRELLVPFKKMAKRNGMTVGGAASVALNQWLIRMQAESLHGRDTVKRRVHEI